jgi:hypothetical protein
MYYIRIGPTAAVPGVGNAETVQQASASDAMDAMDAMDAANAMDAMDAMDAMALYHYCRNCGHELKIEKTICVSKLQLKHNAQSYSNVINKYTKLDPTLPRINNIKCPNSQCRSNPSVADAAAVIRMKRRPRAHVRGGLEEAENEGVGEEQYEDFDEGVLGGADSADGASKFTFSTREPEPREVIYIRYDEMNMKYVYMCAVCDTVWNTAQSNIL